MNTPEVTKPEPKVAAPNWETRVAALERSLRRWQIATASIVLAACVLWGLSLFGEKRFASLTVGRLLIDSGGDHDTMIVDQGIFLRRGGAIEATFNLGDKGGTLAIDKLGTMLSRSGLRMPGITLFAGTSAQIALNRAVTLSTPGSRTTIEAGELTLQGNGGSAVLGARPAAAGLRLDYDGGIARWPEK